MEEKKQIDFIGVGFAKCGTTYIAKLLSEHPNIFIPESKELNYFSPVNPYYTKSEKLLIDQYKEYGIEKYFDYFNNSNKNKINGEYSTHYNNLLSAKRIKKHFPNTKILITIRNPINRVLSSYNYFDSLKSSFEKSFSKNKNIYTVDNSYYETINIYLKLFGKENIKIIIFENFIKNPLEGIKELYKFLGVNTKIIPYSINKKINKTTIPKFKILYKLSYNTVIFSNKIKKHKIGLILINLLKLFGIEKLLSIFLKRENKKYSKKINKNVKKELFDFYIKDTKKLSKLIGKDLNEIWDIK